MAIEITIDDDNLDMVKVVKEFYDQLSPKLSEKSYAKFLEYLHRMKGTNSFIHEQICDFVTDEIFWAGVWLGKTRADIIEIKEVDEPTDEELSEEDDESEEGSPTSSSKDPMFG